MDLTSQYQNLRNYDSMESMVGKQFNFYGVCMNEFKLNSLVWEAIEDESDGYRSYLQSIEKTNSTAIFFPSPLDVIKVVSTEREVRENGKSFNDFEGYLLSSVSDDHVWLRIGTNCSDSYYPYFVFDYTPRTEINK